MRLYFNCGTIAKEMASREDRLRWMKWVRPQDVIMVVLFAAMAAASPTLDASEGALLFVLAGLQIAGPKLPFLRSPRGKVLWIALELIFAYLLIGYTGGIVSNYYLILLLPMISAATYLGLVGSLLFTLLSCGSYISFVRFVDFSQFTIDPDQVRVLAMRMIFVAVAGNLVNVLAEALRVQSANYRRAAEELAEANRNLQEAEAAVRRTERLAALGQLSAGLAHELRNPLGTIKTSAEMLLKNVPGDNAVAREMAGFISSEVDRTNSLVTRFLDFARPLAVRLEKADLTQVIDQAVSDVEKHQPPFDVTIYKNYSPEIPPFFLDGELMERVIYNLLLNAAQASPPSGSVTVKTRQMDSMVEIAVIDRGAGIDPKHVENI